MEISSPVFIVCYQFENLNYLEPEPNASPPKILESQGVAQANEGLEIVFNQQLTRLGFTSLAASLPQAQRWLRIICFSTLYSSLYFFFPNCEMWENTTYLRLIHIMLYYLVDIILLVYIYVQVEGSYALFHKLKIWVECLKTRFC